MENNLEKELGWDDQIENDGQDFIILPEGDYNFEVTSFERARHDGSDKLPPCNKAVVFIKIMAPTGESTTIKHSILHWHWPKEKRREGHHELECGYRFHWSL